jgi:hypothetical protein
MARTTLALDPVHARIPASASPVRAGTLARTCDCGNHAAGGTCPACAAEARRRRVSRFAERSTGDEHDDAGPVPPIVHDVLRGPGQELPGEVRAFMEPRFAADFSDVRLHTDASAAQSSRAVSAHAYTAGSHIVFAAGQYQPSTPSGQRLLAHELTHVVQQRGIGGAPGAGSASHEAPSAISDPADASEREAEATAARVLSSGASSHREPASDIAPPSIAQPGAGIQRLGALGAIGIVGGLAAVDLLAGALGAFDRDVYTTKELQAYLDRLAQRRQIEGSRNSDNKARDVVRHYREGDEAFDLDKGYHSPQGALATVDLKRLLVLEMLDGWPGDADQKAILTIVGRTKADDLLALLDPAKGLSVNELDEQLQGENHVYLKAYLESHFPKGAAVWEQVSAQGGCGALQAVMILKARQAAAPRVAHAIAALDHPDDPTIRRLINCYFPRARRDQIDAIKAVFAGIATELPTRVYHCQPVTRPMAPGGQPQTLDCGPGDAGSSWVDLRTKVAEPEVVLCPKFFKLDPEQQAITIIHEGAHAGGATEDIASEVKCGQLDIASALQNAESFAYLASALFAQARIPAVAPPPAGAPQAAPPPAGAPAGAKEPAR